MQKELIRKGLVLSVIVLFIGVGIQPAFAEESITSTLDKDEDCIECQETDGYSLLRAKILLFRVKVVTNVILSSKLGEIPEIKEDCKEILELINSNKFLEPPLIECSILLIYNFVYTVIGIYCNMLIPVFLYPIFPNLTLLIMAFGYNMYIKGEEFYWRAYELDCDWIWDGPENFNRAIGEIER